MRAWCAGHAALAAALAAFVVLAAGPVHAQPAPAATSCQAFAGSGGRLAERSGAADAWLGPRDTAARIVMATALEAHETRLTYVTHSTFLIESAGGVRIATDYAGYAGPGPAPDAVTMNRAHSTHYTDFPDPAIRHVLRGWNPDGGHAEHNAQIGDVHIRNVPTNIRSWSGGTVEFGNSIFIFEMTGLCIVHLGHLHHELSAREYGQIGLVDVVLVPVDGSFTLDHDGMIAVLAGLHARLIVPMHYFSGASLARFLERMRPSYGVRTFTTPTVVLSRATLPAAPEIWVVPPMR